MVSWTGLVNKAFGRADASSTPNTPPPMLTRVTGNYTHSGQALSSMSADSAIKWYERVTTIFRSVDLIATTQCSIPIIVRNKNGEGTVEDDQLLFRLLNLKPNSYESADAFRYRVSSLLLLDPRGVLIEVQKSAAGLPAALHIIAPGQWRPVREQMDGKGNYANFLDCYEVSSANGTTRILPDDAIWIKAKPHPSDPYMQMTPLMASRLATETDYFARLFNRNFLVNDGRPGLLIAVKGHVSEEDSEELKRRFSGGYTRAGQTTVIESEGLDIRDLASSPRDIQWEAAVKGSDDDIRLAFGTPESVLGNASGRTFNNADAEWSNFWELTMIPHCNAITTELDKLEGSNENENRVIHDYSKVAVLQIPKREEEQLSLQRWKDGIVTLNQHLEAIGMDTIDEDYANVHFLHNNIIAGPMEQAKAVAALPIVAVPDPMAMFGAMQGAQGDTEEIESGTSVTQLGTGYEDYPEDEVFDAEFVEDETKGIKELVHRARMIKALVPVPKPAYNRDRVEGAIHAVCEYWSKRQGEIVASRLDHAKFREGTRFWEDKNEKKAAARPVDPMYAVEASKWTADIVEALAQRMEEEIEQAIWDNLLPIEVRNPTINDNGVMREPSDYVDVDFITHQVVRNVRNRVEIAAAAQSAKLSDLIAEMDANGNSLAEIKDAIRQKIAERSSWHERLALEITTLSMEQAAHETYKAIPLNHNKTWHCHEDAKTRDAHRKLDGQTVPHDFAFMSGGIPIRYPGDPAAPIALTANCRCWIHYHA